MVRGRAGALSDGAVSVIVRVVMPFLLRPVERWAGLGAEGGSGWYGGTRAVAGARRPGGSADVPEAMRRAVRLTVCACRSARTCTGPEPFRDREAGRTRVAARAAFPFGQTRTGAAGSGAGSGVGL